MLTLTAEATTAIERILAAPAIPDGAGIRIAAALPSNSSEPVAGLEVRLAEKPAESDQVIEDAGARVFVQHSVVDPLADKLLDAHFADDRLSFRLDEQS